MFDNGKNFTRPVFMSIQKEFSPPGAEGGDIEISDSCAIDSNPLVSVVIITYNHVRYIREALDSVLMQQTDFLYEICLGEDGSTDGTRQICEEYGRRYPDKIRLFLRDRTIPARQNYKVPFMHNWVETLNACRGKYIAFLDGDDYWTNPRKLQSQAGLMESDPGLAVCAHYTLNIREERPWLAGAIPQMPVDRFSLDDVLKRNVENLHTSSWMVRRNKSVDWQVFANSNFGDLPVLVSSLLGGEGRVLPQVMSVYRIHTGGIFGPLSDSVRLCQNIALWALLRRITPSESLYAVDFGAVRTWTRLVAEYRKEGQLGESVKVFRCALSAITELQACRSSERVYLKLLAIEALLFPRLQGIRNRINRWRAAKALPASREPYSIGKHG